MTNWNGVRHSVLGVYEESANYLLDLLTELFADYSSFEQFVDCVCNDSFFQYEEGYFVHLPSSLVEDFRFNGKVEVIWDKFDGQEHVQQIALTEFVLCIKISIMFYASSIKKNYQQMKKMGMLDKLLEKYPE